MARTPRIYHASQDITLRRLWSSYWFLPVLMTSAAILLLIAAINADTLVRNAGLFERFAWLEINDHASASALLNTLVGALFTVIGTVFSLTMVVLALAASQYGAHILQQFMSDNSTKFVLGAFIATFAYCFLALMWLATREQEAEVPQVAVSGAMLLTLGSVGMLVYFIHHLALSIQVATIIKTLGFGLLEAAELIYPADATEQSPASAEADAQADASAAAYPDCGHAIRARTGGYIEAVDLAAALRCTSACDLVLCVKTMPGTYVVPGKVLAYVHGQAEADQRARLQKAFIIGSQRTHFQDILYSVEKLAEVAVRALSPGINEPYVAVKCVDYLVYFIAVLAARRAPSAWLRDSAARPRIYFPAVTFRKMLESAFDQIVLFTGSNAAVMQHLLTALANIESQNTHPAHAAALQDYRRELRGIICGRQWEGDKDAQLARLCE